MRNQVYINGIGILHPGVTPASMLAAFGGQAAPEAEQNFSPLAELLPGVSLRRVPKVARLALHAAALALTEAGGTVPLSGSAKTSTGVFTGSAHGAVEGCFEFMDSIIKYGAHLASPTAFSYSVHNVFTGMLSLYLGAQGPSFTSGQFGMSFAGALQAAVSSLLQGGCDCALLCVAEDVSDFLNMVYSQQWCAGWDDCLPEASEAQCALCFALSREKLEHSVAISVPVWDVQAAQAEAKDILFASAKCKKLSAAPQAANATGSSPCVVDCHSLYGSTPAVQALDVAMAALALRSSVLPVPDWCVAGAPPAAFKQAACELYEPLTNAYSSITLEKTV